MSNKLKEYEKFVTETKIYKGDQPLFYAGLGLTGEAGEVADEIKKFMRDDDCLTVERIEKILLECGDTLWYLTHLIDMLGSSLEEVMEKNTAKLTARRKERGR